MAEKFRNKYRIASTRLQIWDYASKGAYFVTICTQGRQHFFGNIANGRMQLSEIGKILEQEWIETPKIRPDMNLTLDAFVVMPNHFHGIIIIGDNIHNRVGYRAGAMNNYDTDNGTTNNGTTNCRDAMHCVSIAATTNNTDPNTNTNDDTNDDTNTNAYTESESDFETYFELNFQNPPPPNKFGPQSKNLASIIRGMKSSVTTQAKISGHNNFGWQSRYHDHIIRNTVEFYRIRNYIINNPAKWKK